MLTSNWPIQIARLLADEVVPLFGVPEALLSDRGTNLLSYLMKDVCSFLGIKKLNTTAYHPQCDGMVERFNRTLIAILKKHVEKFGMQWDDHIPGILWAYCNTPHQSTGEKPSYLLFGFDCRSPTEASLLPISPNSELDITDYRRELTLSMKHTQELAAISIQKAQTKYKEQYDKSAASTPFTIGDMVLVQFPQEESGPK